MFSPATLLDTKNFSPSDDFKVFFLKKTDMAGDGRRPLRQSLSNLLIDNNYTTSAEILDINHRPQHEQLNISLSHCADAALIGWVAKPSTIGVDIELIERINKAVIGRVSSPEERAGALDQRLIWSAKEAAFKAVSEGIKVISSVETFDWQSEAFQTWSFKARHLESKKVFSGKGEIRLISEHSVAFFQLAH